MRFLQYLLLLLLSVISCAPKVQVVDREAEQNSEAEQKWLTFLEDGKTAKQDVLLRLGLPSAQFEGERILAFRLMMSKDQGLVLVSRELDAKDPRISQWAKAEYSLILVFDDHHILQWHNLVLVR